MPIGKKNEERKKNQEILVSIDIKFLKTPNSALKDQLKNGICYNEILKILLNATQAKSFSLIEHFAFFCHQEIKKKIQSKEDFLLKILVHKTHPPTFSALKGGAFYSYGDEF